MSDERPIEEIIGWRWDVIGLWWDPTTPRWRTRAEVDDLVAWLDDHALGRWRAPVRNGAGWWHVHTWGQECCQGSSVSTAWEEADWHPTIRDALIAAVRKVAAANVTA